MKPTFVLVFAVVALVGATGAVAATNNGTQPAWPGDGTTTNESNATTTVSPGQQLAGVVGAQGASLQGELWNRTLTERLANATTPEARAEVIEDEAETLEAYLDGLELARENLTGAWESGELSEGRYRASLAEFVIRAHTVERRANQTARAAERLPPRVREAHDINATSIRTLGERAHELYQFEGEIGQEVANETLGRESGPLNASGKFT